MKGGRNLLAFENIKEKLLPITTLYRPWVLLIVFSSGDPGASGASTSVPSSAQSQLEGVAHGFGSGSARSTMPAEATVSGGDSGGGWRGERTPSQSQGFQESAGARTTETTSSSSTNPTEGGPPGLAESKDGDEGEDGGEAGQASAAVSRCTGRPYVEVE